MRTIIDSPSKYPGGTTELSPALQRWVEWPTDNRLPEGSLEELRDDSTVSPSVESRMA